MNGLDIQNRIFTIRNMQVMMDRDLANIYGVKPVRLREQAKRNIDRFPDDFMVSQNAIPSRQHLGSVFSKFDVGSVEMLGRLS